MDIDTLKLDIQKFNDAELFYKEYYYARQQEYSLRKFLATINWDFVRKNNLIIPEIASTVPDVLEDYYFMDINDSKSIGVIKHNRYTPLFLHSSNYFEMIYVYTGKSTLTVSNSKIKLKMGDICIIPPGVEHTLGVFDESIILNVLLRTNTLHDIFFNFLRTPNMLSEYFLNIISSNRGSDYIIFHTGNDDDLRGKFLYMLKESISKEPFHYQMISNTIMLVFGSLIRNYDKSVEQSNYRSNSDNIRSEIIRIIQDDYATITLDNLAEQLNYSKEHTSKFIKESTGMNFTDILRMVRMKMAKNLLEDTNMPVADIGEKVGYNSNEHFIRTYKKHFNETPTQSRKKIRK